MKLLYYVPTITSEKYVHTPVEGVTAPKTNFHVDIYENKKNADKELIGTASVVLGPPNDDSVLYIRVATKYEHTTHVEVVSVLGRKDEKKPKNQ